MRCQLQLELHLLRFRGARCPVLEAELHALRDLLVGPVEVQDAVGKECGEYPVGLAIDQGRVRETLAEVGKVMDRTLDEFGKLVMLVVPTCFRGR